MSCDDRPLDVQVGGDHYKSMAIQPMEYSMANKLDACQHTIIKYVTRFRDKGGIQDLEKAKHCIDLLIHFERQAAALSFVDEAMEFIDPADVEISEQSDKPCFAELLYDFRRKADAGMQEVIEKAIEPYRQSVEDFLATVPCDEPASAIDDDSERMQAIGRVVEPVEDYGNIQIGDLVSVISIGGFSDRTGLSVGDIVEVTSVDNDESLKTVSGGSWGSIGYNYKFNSRPSA